MLKAIKKSWSQLADKLAGKELFWYKSPSGILLLSKTKDLLGRFCKGRTLDVGAGRMAYKMLLMRYCSEYKSLDFAKTHQDIDYVVDAQNMEGVESDSFETIFCSQVLEHVPDPQKAFFEINRVLKKNGHAIISVPFLGYLHNEPNDFHRYTKHALKDMSEKAGLEILEISEVGGFFSFIGYIWSTFFLGTIFSVSSAIGWVAFFINIPISYILIFLDVISFNKKLMPLNYFVVMQKNE